MGNTSSQKQKKIKNVLPQTAEEKREMKRAHIVKPCPEMYHLCQIECGWKWESNMSTVLADCRNLNLSVTARTRALSSHPSSSRPLNLLISCVCASAVRMAHSVTMSIKSILASSFDFSLTYLQEKFI